MENNYEIVKELKPHYAIITGIAALLIDKRVFRTVEECQLEIPCAIPSSVFAVLDKNTGKIIADDSCWLSSYTAAVLYHSSFILSEVSKAQ